MRVDDVSGGRLDRGLVVPTVVPQRLLWAPTSGRVDVTVTASTDPGCMLAVWLVGTEHLDERDSGEVCLFEEHAEAVGDWATTARVGVKAHHDPQLATDMTEVVVPVGRGQRHAHLVGLVGRRRHGGVLPGLSGLPLHPAPAVPPAAHGRPVRDRRGGSGG